MMRVWNNLHRERTRYLKVTKIKSIWEQVNNKQSQCRSTTRRMITSGTNSRRAEVMFPYNVSVIVYYRKISNCFLRALETGRKASLGDLYCPVSQSVQVNYIFVDNVRILFLSCNLDWQQFPDLLNTKYDNS